MLYHTKTKERKEWVKQEHLFTHWLKKDRFDFGNYPSRSMLNQHLGSNTRLLRLKRKHVEGEFLLNTQGYFTLLFPGMSELIVKDVGMRSFRMVGNESYMILAPGTYLLQGRAYSGAVFECTLVRFRKNDIATWASAGMMPKSELHMQPATGPSQTFRTYRCGHEFNPHIQMANYLANYIHVGGDANVRGYLQENVLQGDDLPVSEQEKGWDAEYAVVEFLEGLSRRKRVKGLNQTLCYSEILKWIKEENLNELLQHRDTL